MSGLNQYDYGARYYDPAIARFTTMDPMCEKYYSISPYAYCANNPVNRIDPDGRSFLDFVAGIIHAVGSNLALGTIPTNTSGVSNASHYNAGRNVGDVVSVLMGTGETILGTGVAAVGIAAAPETAGASLTVTAEGAAAAIHGLAVTETAAKSMETQEGRMSQASSSSSGEKKAIGPAGDAGANVTKQLPDEMQSNSKSTKNGTIFHDPANPKANSVRVEPGNPNSSNPGQQSPYVKEVRNGKIIDKNGNEVKNRTQESHIPNEEYKYNKNN